MTPEQIRICCDLVLEAVEARLRAARLWADAVEYGNDLVSHPNEASLREARTTVAQCETMYQQLTANLSGEVTEEMIERSFNA